jgi:hypothetical protein
MLKMRHFYPVVLVFLSGFLTACSNDINELTSASVNYVANQGNTATANLDNGVANTYSNTVSTASSIALSSADILSSSIAAVPAFTSLSAAGFSPAAAESQNGSCENPDGSVSVTRNVDATTKQGYMDIELQNCLSDNTYLDGSVRVNVYIYDDQANQPTSINYTYQELKVTQGTTKLTLTGSLDAQQSVSNGTSRSTIDMYMLGDSEQALVQMVVDTVASGATVSTSMDGKVCVGATGCAEVETVTSMLMSYFAGVKQGSILLKGADGSSINLSAS